MRKILIIAAVLVSSICSINIFAAQKPMMKNDMMMNMMNPSASDMSSMNNMMGKMIDIKMMMVGKRMMMMGMKMRMMGMMMSTQPDMKDKSDKMMMMGMYAYMMGKEMMGGKPMDVNDMMMYHGH